MTDFVSQFGIREKKACFDPHVSPVLMENEDIWNFHGSLTLNKRKLICDFRSPWYAIVSNMTHFFHSVWHEKKMTCFELCASPVLTQKQHILNFHGSLTLNDGKII